MSKPQRNKILSGIVTVILIFAIVITFASMDAIPTWDDVFSVFGISGQKDGYADFVRFIDVGQGEAILIGSNNQSFMIDSGMAKNNPTAKLLGYGIKSLDAFLLTHCHDDHYGSMKSIKEVISIKNLIIPDLIKTSEETEDIVFVKNKVLEEGGDVYIAVQGMNFRVGDFEITLIGYYPECSEENSRSIVVMARIDKIKFLLTGDLEKDGEELLLNNGLNLECDVLKVGHHGSSSSTTTAFLNATSPDYAVISCGRGNNYSHPHEEVISRLENSDVKEIYRTDISGDITFYVEDNELRITTEK